jgi:hypothetical protein
MLVAVFCAASSAAFAAQASSVEGTDLQSWDEWDFFTRLLLSRTSLGSLADDSVPNWPNPANYVFETDWNVAFGRYLEIAPSHDYFVFRTASGAKGHGQSPILGVTPFVSRGRWTVSDQSRFRGRFGTDGIGPSWDYRNRSRIDYRVGRAQRGASIFPWDEVFYYSEYRDWTMDANNSTNVWPPIFTTSAKITSAAGPVGLTPSRLRLS